jgi:hypothetical protein
MLTSTAAAQRLVGVATPNLNNTNEMRFYTVSTVTGAATPLATIFAPVSQMSIRGMTFYPPTNELLLITDDVTPSHTNNHLMRVNVSTWAAVDNPITGGGVTAGNDFQALEYIPSTGEIWASFGPAVPDPDHFLDQQLVKLDLSGVVTATGPVFLSGFNHLQDLDHLGYDPTNGKVYGADYNQPSDNNMRFFEGIDPFGAPSTVNTEPLLPRDDQTEGLAIDNLGNRYACDFGTNELVRVAGNAYNVVGPFGIADVAGGWRELAFIPEPASLSSLAIAALLGIRRR